MNVVLLGSGDDVPKGRAIAEGVASPRLFDYTGKTSLRELMAAIAMSRFVHQCRYGPLHIANAPKKELIALFGPTCPDRDGAVRRRPQRIHPYDYFAYVGGDAGSSPSSTTRTA